MKKKSIEKHERRPLIKTIQSYLARIDREPYHGIKRMRLVIKLFKLQRTPRYFQLLEMSESYRTVVIAKIANFIDAAINNQNIADPEHRIKLVSELVKLRNKIQQSGPYGPTVNYTGIPDISLV